MHKDCVLVVVSNPTKKGDISKLEIADPTEWWRFVEYKTLPVLKQGMYDPPACLDIADSHKVPNARKDGENTVVMMTDGTVYAFSAPQHTNGKLKSKKPLVLKNGYTLNVATMETRSTASSPGEPAP